MRVRVQKRQVRDAIPNSIAIQFICDSAIAIAQHPYLSL
jgi:hypothetical protein